MERVGVPQLEAQDAEDAAGDVPRGARVPAVRDLDDDAEALGKRVVDDGEAQQAVSTFLRDDPAVARFQNGAVQPVEAAYEIWMADHRIPDPVLVARAGQCRVEPRELGHRVG